MCQGYGRAYAGNRALEAVKSLTLDQYEWLMKNGGLDEENPSESPEVLAAIKAKVDAKYADQLAKLAGLQIAPEATPEVVKASEMSVEEELAAMGLRVKADEGPANG